ncbi:MAG: flagellar hook-associated protein FlgK [Desulfobacter sp.]|nr:MAG: flagellar hook-associated protein FlgK [Desulfobacter sp.]
MAGLSSVLNISKTAIASQQQSLNISGQNIANVNNPNYSVQNADHISRQPAEYGGFLFGTGVNINQVRQSVDKLLEERLTTEISAQAAFEEQESYMRVLENFFDTGSQTSLTTVMNEFWNSWHEIANNPQGSAERVKVFESGKKLASRFESVFQDMDSLVTDINSDIRAAVGQINDLATKIADLNQEIIGNENNRTSNDQRDQRNGLVDELGTLIDIDVIEQPNGSFIINAANGFTLVNGVSTYPLGTDGTDVVWGGTVGKKQPITDKITKGQVGGLLEMRDRVIPKYQAEINELAREMIWSINYQHSQGAGLGYFNDPVTGHYATDESHWLTSFPFGNKIDSTKDFTMWVEDKTDADVQYSKINMDMGISSAGISNFSGLAPGGVQSIYRLTVVDEGDLGDKEVIESDGDGLARVLASSGANVSATLDAAIAEQTITVYDGPDGTQSVKIKDAGGNAKRSAASIAEALNQIEGVSAHASKTSFTLKIDDGVLPVPTSYLPNAHDGDEVSFNIYVDGLLQTASFIRDSSSGTMDQQFEDALLAAAEKVNNINEDKDLAVNGLTLESASGRTLGVQDFDVKDNAGIRLDTFADFNAGDQVTFSVDAMVPGAGTVVSTTNVTVDLGDVGTPPDEAKVAEAFSDALSAALDSGQFSVSHDPATNSVVVRTKDGNGVRLGNGANDTGSNATINVTAEPAGGSAIAAGDASFLFNGADVVRYDPVLSTGDQVVFSAKDTDQFLVEAGAAAGNKNAVITGTLTLTVDEGMVVQSDIAGAGTGGIFSVNQPERGRSILTLGGEGGFSGITAGETIQFNLDGQAITVNIPAGVVTDDVIATALDAALSGTLSADYNVIRTGNAVSVLKKTDQDEPIKITDFVDSAGNDAAVQVRTGTGTGTNPPENQMLSADITRPERQSATSTLYNDPGTIMWERLDKDGLRTGVTGIVTVEDEGPVVINESGSDTIKFDISKGKLVAGNVITVNTDEGGVPDPLDFRVTGRANGVNELYQFKVVSGGKVGHEPKEGEEPLVIEWSNSVKTGTFTIEGENPPRVPQVPVEVQVDGMNLKFAAGTLFTDDVFTITTGDNGIPKTLDENGYPTGETESRWHWTLDSFAGQFNRQGHGMEAIVTNDHRLQFQASDEYYTVQKIEYSGENGFAEENVSIQVKDWSNVNFGASDFGFVRSASGVWGVVNDPTGGTMTLIPEGGDDNGFELDFNGDGLGDIRIDFKEAVTGAGQVEFDLRQRNTNDIGYAFSDDASQDSGLMAAAGINTLFKGTDAISMEINEVLKDTKYVGAAKIDSETGIISQGDNTNALDLASVQFQSKEMKIWTYTRGEEAKSNTTTASIDNYFNTIISSMGIESRSIKSSKSFSDTMVQNMSEQRDAVSAVSLDEEMIKLIKYQHAFSAASKLITVSDEMLSTLISVR